METNFENGEIRTEDTTQTQEQLSKPDNHMALAIISIFFSLIFGIIATVYASKVNSLWAQGKYEEAEKASKTAKNTAILGFVMFIFGLIKILI